MVKIMKKICCFVLAGAVLCIPALADRAIANFYFSTVAYDWGGGDTIYVQKFNESDAVINTLETAGGSVTPWQLFNTRLQMWKSGDDPEIVGHRWACSPDAREYIPYDYDDMTGALIRAQFSTRSSGATATMDGSWSPDSY